LTPPPRHPHSFPTRRSSDLSAIEQLMRRRDWASAAREATHTERIEKAIAAIDVVSARPGAGERPFTLSAKVYNVDDAERAADAGDRKSTRLNSSHVAISYAV